MKKMHKCSSFIVTLFGYALLVVTVTSCSGPIIGGVRSGHAILESKAPCHDGWTTDSSGPSVSLSTKDIPAGIISQMEPLGDIVCAHSMPSGRVVVLSIIDNSVYAFSFEKHVGSYTQVREEYVTVF